MRLKEIKPGMSIRCHNFEQGEAVVKQLKAQGAVFLGANSPNYTDEHCVVFLDSKNQYSFYKYFDATCDFSDLILPELTAEEAVEWLLKNYYNGNYISAFDKDYSIGNLLDDMTPEEIVSKISQWKAKYEHEKKEPEIETVDICRIIEIQPDGKKRCVHEEEIKPELPFDSDKDVSKILKRYCMEHDGEFIAVHEVVSRVKAVE